MPLKCKKKLLRSLVSIAAAIPAALSAASGSPREFAPDRIEALRAFAARHPGGLRPEALPHLQLVAGIRREDAEKLIRELAEYLQAGQAVAAARRLRRSEEILRLAEMVDEASVREAVASAEATERLAGGGFADRCFARPFHYFWNLGFHAHQKAADEFAERAAIRRAVREVLQTGEVTSLSGAFEALRKKPPSSAFGKWLSAWGSRPFDPLWRWAPWRSGERAYGEFIRVASGGAASQGRLPTLVEIEAGVPAGRMPDLWLAAAKGLRRNGLYEAARGVLEEYFLRESLESAERADRGPAPGEQAELRREIREAFERERAPIREEIREALILEGSRKVREAPAGERERVRREVKGGLTERNLDGLTDEKIRTAAEEAFAARLERFRADDAYKRLVQGGLKAGAPATKAQAEEAFAIVDDMLDPADRRGNISDGTWDGVGQGVTDALLTVIPAGRVSSVFARAAGKTAEMGAARLMVRAFGAEVGQGAMALARVGARTGASFAVSGVVFHNVSAALQSLRVGSAAWEHYWRGVAGAMIMMGSIESGKLLFAGLVRNGWLAKRFALAGGELKPLEKWDPGVKSPLPRPLGAAAWGADFLAEGTAFTVAGRIERLLTGELSLDELPDSALEDFARSLLTLAELRIAGGIAHAAPAAERLLAGKVPAAAGIPKSVFPAAADRMLAKVPDAARIAFAKELLGREISGTESEAILRAHRVGLGRPRTDAVLRGKVRLLRGEGGFTDRREIRRLVEHFVAGEPAPRWDPPRTARAPALERTEPAIPAKRYFESDEGIRAFMRYPNSPVDLIYLDRQIEAWTYFDRFVRKAPSRRTSYAEMLREQHLVLALGADGTSRAARFLAGDGGAGRIGAFRRSDGGRPVLTIYGPGPLGSVLSARKEHEGGARYPRSVPVDGIPEMARPMQHFSEKGSRGTPEIVHSYPDAAHLNLYLSRLETLFARVKQSAAEAGGDAGARARFLRDLSVYYHTALNARPFEWLNRELFMNQANYFLVRAGLRPVFLGELELPALGLGAHGFGERFARWVEEAQKPDAAAVRGLADRAKRRGAAQLFLRLKDDRKTALNDWQAEGIELAHRVGEGEPGADGGPARAGNYTPDQVRRKIGVLASRGFNATQRRILLETGVAGEKPEGGGAGRRRVEEKAKLAQLQNDISDLHTALVGAVNLPVPEIGREFATRLEIVARVHRRSLPPAREKDLPESIRQRVSAYAELLGKLDAAYRGENWAGVRELNRTAQLVLGELIDLRLARAGQLLRGQNLEAAKKALDGAATAARNLVVESALERGRRESEELRNSLATFRRIVRRRLGIPRRTLLASRSGATTLAQGVPQYVETRLASGKAVKQPLVVRQDKEYDTLAQAIRSQEHILDRQVEERIVLREWIGLVTLARESIVERALRKGKLVRTEAERAARVLAPVEAWAGRAKWNNDRMEVGKLLERLAGETGLLRAGATAKDLAAARELLRKAQRALAGRERDVAGKYYGVRARLTKKLYSRRAAEVVAQEVTRSLAEEASAFFREGDLYSLLLSLNALRYELNTLPHRPVPPEARGLSAQIADALAVDAVWKRFEQAVSLRKVLPFVERAAEGAGTFSAALAKLSGLLGRSKLSQAARETAELRRDWDGPGAIPIPESVARARRAAEVLEKVGKEIDASLRVPAGLRPQLQKANREARDALSEMLGRRGSLAERNERLRKLFPAGPPESEAELRETLVRMRDRIGERPAEVLAELEFAGRLPQRLAAIFRSPAR